MRLWHIRVVKNVVASMLAFWCVVHVKNVDAQTRYRIIDRSTIELRLNSIPGKAKDDERKEARNFLRAEWLYGRIYF
jgi:hypothetical protein